MAEIEYEILEKIGHGSFGLIRKVRRKRDGQVLCRKEVSYIRMSQAERQQLYAEFSILSSLRHPNIVAYYHREHLKATQDLHLYMEYCGNGDLGRVIRQLKTNNQYAEEEFVWSVFSQLVTALYRCHYGVDPPEVGRNATVAGKDAKPVCADGKKPVMILHRDLKPENVFLTEDNAVKLGDFGLSKIMQSHDFASTYVGTPFYMSPEICAAERYTLHSDIWSLGCVMYELCAREPPFNARNHFQLVQKIKEGRVAPLPPCYSPELQAVIKSCLQVNPRLRPDTATLLNLPAVRLMRKEREVVELGKALKSKEELASRRLKEIEERQHAAHAELELRRKELDASLRREWEAKARLEIERRVQQALDQLAGKFEAEVQERVQIELQRRVQGHGAGKDVSEPLQIPTSSVGSQDETDFPSTTDLSALSLESPAAAKTRQPIKNTRTPFGRSRTMFVGSPMDVQMVDPSPMSIASLSLSPRRQALGVSGARNIFATAAEERQLPDLAFESDDDDGGEISAQPPSPSERAADNDTSKAVRPRLQARMTAPVSKSNTIAKGHGGMVPNATDRAEKQTVIPVTTGQPALRADTSRNESTKAQRKPPTNRRLSKLPENSTLVTNESGSPVPKGKRPIFAGRAAAKPQAGGEEMHRAAIRNNMMKGRSLVELEQARLASHPPASKAEGKPASGEENSKGPKTVEVVWDPEKDEMPSPFLVRGPKGARKN